MTKQGKKSTSHDVQDKPLIEVDPQSFAALVANKKYINVLKRDVAAGFIRGIDDGDWQGNGDGDDDEPESVVSNVPGPGIEDIFIKYGTAYERPTSLHKYGTLYDDNGQSGKVSLDFKVMIPLALAESIVGVEVLSENEVIATI